LVPFIIIYISEQSPVIRPLTIGLTPGIVSIFSGLCPTLFICLVHFSLPFIVSFHFPRPERLLEFGFFFRGYMALSLKAELEIWAAALKAYDEQDFLKSLGLFSVSSAVYSVLVSGQS